MAVATNISNVRKTAEVTVRYSSRVGELRSPEVVIGVVTSVAPKINPARYYGTLAKAFKSRRLIDDDAGVSSFDPDTA